MIVSGDAATPQWTNMVYCQQVLIYYFLLLN